MIVNEEDKGVNSWRMLGAELYKRTTGPAKHATFVIYFIVAIVGVGALGVWVEIVRALLPTTENGAHVTDLSALRTAIITFSPALAGTASLQIILARSHKSLRAFSMLAMVVTSALALILGSSTAIGDTLALSIGGAASFFAMWVWWLANAQTTDFLDIDAPTGGDPSGPVAGSLDGYTY